MVESVEHNSDPSPEPPDQDKSFLQSLIEPSTKKAVGVAAIAALGCLGYWGLQSLVKNKLPFLIETEAEKILHRPLEVGKVEKVSLTGITLGKSLLPVTELEGDRIEIEKIRVGWNLLPLIVRQTLPVTVTITKPLVYLDQDVDGSWLTLDLPPQSEEKKELPIDLDVNVEVEQGDITVVPYDHSPIAMTLDGTGGYNTGEGKVVNYDLDASIAKAKATFQGETVLETGQTTTKVLIDKLALADLATLIPNSPVNLRSGLLNANLDVNIPSFEEIASANLEGTVSLQNLAGKVPSLSESIQAKSQLRLRGRKVQVQNTAASLGEIVAQLRGSVDLEQGYNLDVEVLPFSLTQLQQTIPVKLPVKVEGEIGSQLKVTGELTEPALIGEIESQDTITIDKEQFKSIRANFSGDLSKFVLEELKILPLAGGEVTAEGVIRTNLHQENAEFEIATLPLAFNWQAKLPTEKIAQPYYQFPPDVGVGNLVATGKITGTVSQPNASADWEIEEETAKIIGKENKVSGEGKIVFTENNLLVRDTKLRIDEGIINVRGESNLKAQTWKSNINTELVYLTPFLSQLPLEGVNLNRPITLQNADIILSGKLDALAPEQVNGIANLNLDVDGSNIAVKSQLGQGNIKAQANISTIVVNDFINNLPLPIEVQSSQLEIASKLKPLLNLAENPDLSSVVSNLQADLIVAEGRVKTTASLLNNQWQTFVDGNSINTAQVIQEFLPDNAIASSLDPIDTKVNLAGNLDSLLSKQSNIPIAINNLTISMGEQLLKTQGNLIVSNLQTSPDVSQVNLDVISNINFEQLPIEELVGKVTRDNQLLSERINLRGVSKFQGSFQGKNLISAPSNLENYSLIGDLTLNNLAFNNTVFEPVLAGKLNIKPASILNIDLRGKQDVIAATAEPCTNSNCRFPYLPIALEFRQGENTSTPIIATGKRQGDIFSLDINNFPLALLNLAPGQPAGITGLLTGTTTGNIDVNLYTLDTQGNIAVAKPGVGYIQGENIVAKFNYSVAENKAEIVSSSLKLKDSEYNFDGGVDLKSGALQGRLNIPQAYIQDIFQTLGWYSIEDALNLFQNPEYTTVKQVDPNSIITVQESIARKLKLLALIEAKIQETAAAATANNIPTQLDIRGKYQGEIILDGTINNPQVAFDIEANNWQWETQNTSVTVTNNYDLVKQPSPIIAIPEILIVGKFADNTINLETAKIQVENAILSATGQVSPTQQNGEFQVSNLTVDTIEKFVTIPADIAGTIDVQGTITGTNSQPQILGNLTISDSYYNNSPLVKTLKGDFNYQNQQLSFNTNEPSFIDVSARVPYPIEPGRNSLTADVKLEKEAFALLDTITGGNLTWIGGEGNATIQATANLDRDRSNPLYNLNATGEVNLQDAAVTINNTYFQESVTATGKILLDNQLAKIETLQATFADKDLSVTGTLPLLSPVANVENPLTVNIPPGKIKIKQLYQGNVAGKIIITSAATSPVIGGEVTLEKGRVFIPKADTQATAETSNIKADTQIIETNNSLVSQQTNNVSNTPETNQNNSPAVITTLENFLVKLNKFKIEQTPLYEFGVSGELTLNGTVDNPDNIKPSGTITINQADVDWLSTSFSIVRNRDNLITFSPETGIFNPYVDIQMRSQVSDLNNIRQLEEGKNEISEDISQVGRTETINVNLNVNGEAQELLPTLNSAEENNCKINPDNTSLINNIGHSQAELDKLSDCINLNASEKANARQLLDSPVISLTSIPERSEGEIISLLGNQFLTFAEKLQNSNQEELINLGVTQFVIAPFQRRLFYRAEDFVVSTGRKVGLDYLRVYPYFEGIYQINKDTSISGTYDYVFQEAKLEYKLKF